MTVLNTAPISYWEPSQVFAGYNWIWNKSFTYYPATSFTLKYNLVGANGAFGLTATQYNGGADYSINIAPVVTSGYAAGFYTWTSFVTDGTNDYQLGQGEITVL